ncbi:MULTISPECIES: MFS transporter [Mycobacterium]|uniref:Drug transporter n=1 Tax=Mycobacterium indicus pranii (strain DSM 45239 / MTCC 9506) TaxID=1232724 RepID=J9WBB1_MYCIP|nr:MULTISPECIES: MFS transporter [Mycobacterium]AFS13413.1 Drug transporter [Mycobacterium intracellulare subsp. intracellulare MTCC 9506]WSE50241.1 MFS transporter [Mycobacterium sp. 2-64]BCO50986.1 MFS transporter [Mycobacterium paraintracellulare]BCO88170.1 MFS transporter [Mycobacterium paraintracellulare]
MTTATPRTPGGARRARSGPARSAHRWDFFTQSSPQSQNPWNPLWAMMIGFFMIMVDSTIVAIANPTIMASLRIGYDTVVWVTSAYLLGYAVVLLVAGRLGDRFGPKNLYLFGLVVFTISSVWCGLAGSATMLIAARVVQGVGAGLLTPQTLSTITRIFPAQRRGVAVSLWGATAGVASLVGPLAGGVLVDGLGWQWIFFVNVPIGVIGLGLAYWLIPVLPTQSHRFDLIGVALSGIGIFLIVFGLQQGQAEHWQPWIWALIVAGVGFMTAFAFWQSLNAHEPLIPLVIFSDRDFSVCNVGVAVISFAATAMMLPLTFYAQAVCGLSPTRSALLIAPMAIANGVFAPFVGKIVDKYHPLPVLGFGFSVLAIALTWLTFEMSPTTPIWRLVLPFFATGVGMACVWSPLTATATRNLPPELAGAGSAVYNSVRQLGAVLGSAGMAAFMTWRITVEMPRQPSGGATDEGALALQLPEFLREPFSAAMSQSALLPAFIALFGIIAALFLVGSAPWTDNGRGGDDLLGPDDDVVDDDYDDDEYVELVLVREPDAGQSSQPAPPRLDPPQPRRSEVPPRADSWHNAFDEPKVQPIGYAHNGSRVDSGKRLRQVAVRRPPKSMPPGDRLTRPPRRHHNGSAGHYFTEGESLRGQHHRPDPDDDPTGSGRHSSSG